MKQACMLKTPTLDPNQDEWRIAIIDPQLPDELTSDILPLLTKAFQNSDVYIFRHDAYEQALGIYMDAVFSKDRINVVSGVHEFDVDISFELLVQKFGEKKLSPKKVTKIETESISISKNTRVVDLDNVIVKH